MPYPLCHVSLQGFSLRFCVDSRVQHETPEEGQRIYQPKRCEDNNEDEDNSQNTLRDKNYQTSTQKFRQVIENTGYLFDTKGLS